MELWHMSGAGNDFAVLTLAPDTPELAGLARSLCSRLKADGLLAVEATPEGALRLHFYNADGLRGEMCGNGARCVCRYIHDRGLCRGPITLLTDAGPVMGWALGEGQYRVQLNLPSVLETDRLPGVGYVELGAPGIPHALMERPDLCWQQRPQLLPLGQQLRHDPAFPKGANVTFYRILDHGEVRVLTYERGVEDYTLACGTGCASLACLLWHSGRLPRAELTAHNPGGDLRISLSHRDGHLQAVFLEGPTQVLQKLKI